MCELLTIAATLVFALLALAARRAGRPCRALAATTLVFLGAALMWSVDCVHSFLSGEGLFDLSLDDTFLGLLVLAAGCALFAVLRFREARALR